MQQKDALVVDVDGTLGSSEWRRRKFLSGAISKDWDGFHEALTHDAPNRNTVWLLHAARKAGMRIIVLTMRPERYRNNTVAWLDKNKIPYDELQMKAASDWRKGHFVKADMLKEIAKTYQIRYVVDDDDLVLQHAADTGVVGAMIPVRDPDLEPVF